MGRAVTLLPSSRTAAPLQRLTSSISLAVIRLL